MIRVTCPDCGRVGEYLPAFAGLKVKCKGCPGWIQLSQGDCESPQSCQECGFTVKSGRMADCPRCGKSFGATVPKEAVKRISEVRPFSHSAGETGAVWPRQHTTSPPIGPAGPAPLAADKKPELPQESGRFNPDLVPRERGRFREHVPRLRRLGARTLDAVISACLLVPGYLLALFVNSIGGEALQDSLDDEWYVILITCVALSFQIFFFFFNIYLLSTRGQTVGKWLLGIRVVQYRDGSRVGFVRGFLLRDGVTMFFFLFIPFVGVLYVWVNALWIFGEERSCLHDLIAQTAVEYV